MRRSSMLADFCTFAQSAVEALRLMDWHQDAWSRPWKQQQTTGSPCLGPKVLEFLRLDTRVEASKGACKPCCLPCRSAWVPGLLMQSLSCLVEHFEEHMTGRQNGSIDEAHSLGRRDKEG